MQMNPLQNNETGEIAEEAHAYHFLGQSMIDLHQISGRW